MTEQTLFNEYLSGRITHAKYIGEVKKLNEKHIQNKSSKTSHGGRTSKQQEITSLEEDTWFV
jgi:hypothetical protein